MSILTPDQKLRVFVSSTLHELAPDRAAARRAIQALRFAPVMFEMGARPHPPRNLYRAYLEQSHIFVGIYWQSYGWVAPEMDISGLEDEYRLAGDMPQLLYVKEPAPDRDPKLAALLEEAAGDGSITVRPYAAEDELFELLQDDIAGLLTERFYDEGEGPVEAHSSSAKAAVPVQLTRFVGRSHELSDIHDHIVNDDVRLVTLVGPGGIGKTRLAIEIAERARDHFEDGVRFVALAPLRDAARLPAYLLDSLGIKENTADAERAVEKWLSERSVLLVLDNFEQLLDGTDVVTRLLSAAPRCKILVTSRAVLRIRGEHEISIPPMTLPRDGDGEAAGSDAVTLFAERAAEVQPNLDLGGKASRTVAEICRRLDGLPLAIELAAARVKVMTPEQLLRRLNSRLDVLTGGPRDLPERQQTLRATIDWSYQLLDDDEKELFTRLAVFRRGATLDAIEEVCAPDGDIDVLESVASLIEKSLLRQEVAPTGDARFWMLETVREFAAELFEECPQLGIVKERHAAFYAEMCHGAKDGMAGRMQQLWIAKVEQDYANIRLAASRLLERRELETVAEMCWDLVMFTWVSGHMADARAACELILREPDISDCARSRALAAGGSAIFWQGGVGEAVPMFIEARMLFDKLGDRLGYAQSLVVLGMVSAEVEGLEAATANFEECLEIFESLGNDGWLALALTAYCWILMLSDNHAAHTALYERAADVADQLGAELTLGMSLGNLGMHRLWQGRVDEAMALQRKAIKPLVASDHTAAISYTFLNTAEVMAAMGRDEEAARLIGLSEALLQELDVLPISFMESMRTRVAHDLSAKMGDEAYRMANKEGRGLKVAEGLEIMSSTVPALA